MKDLVLPPAAASETRESVAAAAGLSLNDVRRILRQAARMKRGRIQRAYLVMRDGESTIVPTHIMTTAEMRAKAKSHMAMAHGLMEHAAELEQLANAIDAIAGEEESDE